MVFKNYKNSSSNVLVHSMMKNLTMLTVMSWQYWTHLHKVLQYLYCWVCKWPTSLQYLYCWVCKWPTSLQYLYCWVCKWPTSLQYLYCWVCKWPTSLQYLYCWVCKWPTSLQYLYCWVCKWPTSLKLDISYLLIQFHTTILNFEISNL